ncbi:MAG: response regulator transcription factor [Lachnospiraceae bacterium]|nr:response regulator transcription factor [Lachnospiraceae bacterium]
MSDVNILIADDEQRIRKLLKDFLSKEGYNILEAGDGNEALNIYDTHPDLSLAILDVMMPEMNGYDVAKYIRERSSLPIIMLTAKSAEEDELKGFDVGADEYITKPFSPKILVARVNAVIRRTDGKTVSDTKKIMDIGGIEVDQGAHTVKIDGEEIPLSVKEFELLSYFIQNKGIALSREQILNSVWDYDYFGDARTIDTHVKKLRSKMGEKGDYIKTIWGMGYKFDV